jgi:hypothetical protein
MPIEHLVDHQRRLVEFIFLGGVSRDDIVAVRDSLARSEPEVLGYDAIVDLRRGSFALSTMEIRDVARGARDQRWPRSRCAFVTPHDASLTDLKLFELWSSRGPREYRLFRSLGDACAWLGVECAGLCLDETATA